MTVPAGATAYWLVHDSPTTQILGPGREGHRIIRWASDGLYRSRTTYAVFGFRLLEGTPGRMYDFHTQPTDVGGWTPTCNPYGVAPLAIDYFGNSRGLYAVTQPEEGGCTGGSGTYHFQIMSQAEIESRRGRWIWLWAEITWGRRDIGTKGALKVWVAGEHRPRVSVSGINTHWPGEQMVTFWEGIYHSGGSRATTTVEIAATRFGRTPQEAYSDVPVLFTAVSDGVALGTSAVVGPRASTEAVFFPLRPSAVSVQAERGCRVLTSSRGRIVVRTWGGRDDRDTAVVAQRTSQRDAIVVSYRLRITSERRRGRLVVTQLRSAGRVIGELYVTSRGRLRLSSPAGALRARTLDVATGITVVPGGEPRQLEVRIARGRVTLSADGDIVARLAALDGPQRGESVTVRIGIDRYEGIESRHTIQALFDEVVVGAS